LNPDIKSNVDLASKLGISRQAITKWAKGTDTSNGDCIPFGQLDKVSAIFDISDHWFTLPLIEFEEKLRIYLKLRDEKRRNQKTEMSISMLPVTTTSIVGRSEEILALDRALENSTVTTLQIVAFGGVGKSALVNHWLSKRGQNGYSGTERIYAWSFFEQSSTSKITCDSDCFMEHALEWFGDANPYSGSPWSKATRLANLVRSKNTILILDGLESMQSPPGDRCGSIKNSSLALLVKDLASQNNGLMIITSRLLLTDLESYDDGRIRSINLRNLSESAGVNLLKAMELRGRRKDLKAIVQEYKGHALSLALLGGYFSIVNNGIVEKLRRDNTLLSSGNMDHAVRSLMQLYLEWFDNTAEIAIIYLIGLLRKSIRLNELKTIVRFENLPNLFDVLRPLSPTEWKFTIENLVVANLVSANHVNDDLDIDCHPLVKEFMDCYLKAEMPEEWKKANGFLFEYLSESVRDSKPSLENYEVLFKAVSHGTNAGMYQEAFDVYFNRIKKRFTMIQHGSQLEDSLCIKKFLKDSYTNPVEGLCETSKVRLISSIATNSMALGNVDEAYTLSKVAIESLIDSGKWLEAILVVGPFLSMLLVTGRLNESIDLLHKIQHCIKKTENPVVNAVSKCFHAHALHLSGEDEGAGKMFEEAEKVMLLERPPSSINFPTISSFYCKYLLDCGAVELALDRSLRTFAWRRHNTWQVSFDTTSLLATDMQILGLAFLEKGNIEKASNFLERQVKLFQEADEWLYLPSGLIARAKLYIKTDCVDAAEGDLLEAAESAQRSGAKMSQLEALLELSKLKLGQGDRKMASKYFIEAGNVTEMKSYRIFDHELSKLGNLLNKYPENEPDSDGQGPTPDF